MPGCHSGLAVAVGNGTAWRLARPPPAAAASSSAISIPAASPVNTALHKAIDEGLIAALAIE